jgi:hypothetical protein
LLAFCPYGFGGSCARIHRGTLLKSPAQFRHGRLLRDSLNLTEEVV